MAVPWQRWSILGSASIADSRFDLFNERHSQAGEDLEGQYPFKPVGLPSLILLDLPLAVVLQLEVEETEYEPVDSHTRTPQLNSD